MNFSYTFLGKARKSLRKFDKTYAKNIVLALEEICRFVPPNIHHHVKKLKGYEGRYRLRVGNTRVIFEISHSEKMIFVLEINFRGNISY